MLRHMTPVWTAPLTTDTRPAAGLAARLVRPVSGPAPARPCARPLTHLFDVQLLRARSFGFDRSVHRAQMTKTSIAMVTMAQTGV